MPPPEPWGKIESAWNSVSLPLLALLSAVAAALVARAAVKRYHSNHNSAVHWSSLVWGLIATVPMKCISDHIAYWASIFIARRIDEYVTPVDREGVIAIYTTTDILTALLLVPLFSALTAAGLLGLTRRWWSMGVPPAFRVGPDDP